MENFISFFAVGISAGLIYALLALGIVLIYKGSRILNFAHPFFGLLSAFICWWITSVSSFPPFSWLPFELESRPRFLLASLIAVVLVGLNGWALERRFIRHMKGSPRLTLLVLTIAVAQGTVGLVALLWFRTEQQATTFRRLPALFDFDFHIGQAVITGNHLSTIVITLVIAAVAVVFFTKTKFGVAIRASAENVEAARLLGIPADRISSFVWVVGSVLAAIAGILITQVVGILDINTLGLAFLVRAITAALIGGLTSLSGAVVGGLVVGLGEWMLRAVIGFSRPGPPEVLLFLFIIAVLLFRPGGLFGKPEETEDKVAFVPTIRELPARLRGTASAKGIRGFGLVIPIVIAVLTSLNTGSFTNGILVTVVVFAIVGVSLTLLMGFAGQISLGHWGLAGVGAFAIANLVTRMNIPYFLALPLVVLIGMIVSLIIGLPALRIRGLYLAVTTLAFNVAVELYGFNHPLIGGTSAGIHMSPPKIGPVDLADPSHRPMFFFSLLLLGLCLVVARNLARTRTGRGFFALRENEKAAATLGIDLTKYRLMAFAISGGMAALGGAVFASYFGFVEATTWTTAESLVLVSMVVIGGIGSPSGSIMGAFLVIGLPRLLHFDNLWIVPIGTGILLFIVVARARGGLAGALQRLRERLVEGLAEMERAPAAPAPPAPGS
jgi:ABC-type branched-subunit amino acid transport system permease subunit